MRSKDAELTPELHEYMVERAGGRDDVLRKVEEETEALGGIAIMQTSAEQAALLEMLARASRRAARDRGGHVHRLRRDPDCPRACRRRHPALL